MKTLEFLSSPGMEWAHFSYMQLYRKLVMIKNAILFLLGKLKQRSCLLLCIPHTYQNKRQSEEECLSNPPTSKQLFSPFLAGRHILDGLPKGKVIPCFWNTHSHSHPVTALRFPHSSTWANRHTRVSYHSIWRSTSWWGPEDPSYWLLSLLWVLLQWKPQSHSSYHQGSPRKILLTPSGKERKHFLLSECYMVGCGSNVMCAGQVGWPLDLCIRNVTKHNNGYICENASRLTYGQTKRNFSAI